MTMSLTQVTTGGVDENINIDSNTLKVDGTNNRVGIGTDSAADRLHVAVNASGDQSVLRLSNANATQGNTVGINFAPANDIVSVAIKGIAEDSHNAVAERDGALGFFTRLNGGSVTERMRIDSSGKIGIGVTNASSYDSDANNLVVGNTSSANGITILSGTGNSGGINFADGTGGTDRGRLDYDHGDDRMRFYTASSERMRIDSSGNLLVGLTTAVAFGTPADLNSTEIGRGYINISRDDTAATDHIRFGKNGSVAGSIGTSTSNSLTFKTGTTERMRINSSGDILLACTSNSGSSDPGVKVSQSNNPWLRIVGNESTATSFLLSGYNTNATNNGYRFYVMFNGGIANYSLNNSNISDEREKKNIVNLDSKWDKVKSWELKKFHYNEDADTDDLHYGVIAQQVEEHCPEVLTDFIKQRAEDAVLDDDGNVVTPAVPEIVRKGVKEQQMMWMAIKALQEAQARIETLEAKVAALEAG